MLSFMRIQFLTSKKKTLLYGQAVTQSPTPMHLKLLNSPFSMKAPGMSVRPTGQTLAQSFVLQLAQVSLLLTFILKSPARETSWLNAPQPHTPVVAHPYVPTNGVMIQTTYQRKLK